jgi:DNA (cytosine-5)-methyltransferase 1
MKAIDLFAGAGGFTLAAESVGLDVVFAANHWDLAVRVHSANHPQVQHVQQDLRQFDFSTLDPFDVLLASPSCQGHSNAGRAARLKSGRVAATHDAYRSTAWAVVDCLEVCRPSFAVIENVPEFLDWVLLPDWLSALGRLGYAMSQQVLRASKWGVPQRRKRTFIVARLNGLPISVNDPDVIEAHASTIFDEHADGWISISDMRKTVSQRGEPTARERVEYANERLGGKLGWGAHLSHRGVWGRTMTEPVNTLTTSPGQIWWVRDGMYRTWTATERKRAMGFPADYNLLDANQTQTAKLLGNAVPPPMAAGVLRHVLAAA